MDIEKNVNLLLDQLDTAVTEQDFAKVEKIGSAIESLLEELNGDTIKLRIIQ
jgi:hypothetical protein